MQGDLVRALDIFGLNSVEFDGVRLRPFTRGDFQALRDILLMAPEMRWERSLPSEEEVWNLLDFRLLHYREHRFGVLAVENRRGALIGQAGVQVFDQARERIEVVIFLSLNHLRQSIGSSILREVTTRAEFLGIRELLAAIRHDNVGAERFFSRFGFVSGERHVHYGQLCGIWVWRPVA